MARITQGQSALSLLRAKLALLVALARTIDAEQAAGRGAARQERRLDPPAQAPVATGGDAECGIRQAGGVDRRDEEEPGMAAYPAVIDALADYPRVAVMRQITTAAVSGTRRRGYHAGAQP
jgi:hypothetical protein